MCTTFPATSAFGLTSQTLLLSVDILYGWALTTGRKKEDIYDGEVVIEDRAGVAVVSDEVYALQAHPLVICCDPLINCWASP